MVTMATIVFAKIYLKSAVITDKLRGIVRLETCAAEYTRFPMRFFIEMGRNVPIIIGHSYVSWGTFLFFREGRTE